MWQTLKRQPRALLFSLALHLLVIGLALLEFSGEQKVRPSVSQKALQDQTIKAEVIDQKQLDQREQAIKKQQEIAKQKELAQRQASESARKKNRKRSSGKPRIKSVEPMS